LLENLAVFLNRQEQRGRSREATRITSKTDSYDMPYFEKSGQIRILS